MTIGRLWKKTTHTVPLKAVVGVSVEGVGGARLRIDTAGRAYILPVGIGVGTKIRERILEAMSR